MKGGIHVIYNQDLVKVHKENLKIVEKGGYTLGEDFISIKTGGNINKYIPYKVVNEIRKEVKHEKRESKLTINFSQLDSIQHVINQDYETSTLLINFASAVSPGGGVKNGCTAQEEDICRKTNLYSYLTSKEVSGYYRSNKSYQKHSKGMIGLDNVIITTDISVFRDSRLQLLEEPKSVDILTIAAPRLSKFTNPNNIVFNDNYYRAMQSRVNTIFTLAWYYGYSNLILGAFGCGVFHNPPEIVSGMMMNEAIKFRNDFDNIDFAIMINPNSPSYLNYNTFYLTANRYRSMFKMDDQIDINCI
jgi:uncharacterized protein (TIGR02452 family)